MSYTIVCWRLGAEPDSWDRVGRLLGVPFVPPLQTYPCLDSWGYAIAPASLYGCSIISKWDCCLLAKQSLLCSHTTVSPLSLNSCRNCKRWAFGGRGGGRGVQAAEVVEPPERIFVSSSAFPTQCTAGQCLPLQNETLAEFFLTTAEDKNNKLLSVRVAPLLGCTSRKLKNSRCCH